MAPFYCANAGVYAIVGFTYTGGHCISSYNRIEIYICLFISFYILGLGGLGQLGAVMAKAMGNNVTVFSSSASKRNLAKTLGVDKFVNLKNQEDMTKEKNSRISSIWSHNLRVKLFSGREKH